MRKFAIAFAVALGLAAGTLGASGNCEDNAESIDFKNAVRTVTLVPEYDPDEKTTDTSKGVYYFKSKLIRGGAYTVYTTGLSTNDEVTVYAYSADPKDEDSDKEGASADFTEIDEPGGNTRLVMYADDWYIDEEDKEESDPKKWTYYIEIEGEVGQKVEIHFQAGVNIPAGREENPARITPKTTVQKSSSTLQIDSVYYFRAYMTAGQLYWFATSGGTANSLMSVDMDLPDVQGDETDVDDESDLDVYPDPAYDADEMNTGIFVVANNTGYYNILVSAEGDDADGAPFTLSYRTYAKKGPAEHVSTELSAANGYEADFSAGRKNATASFAAGYYDEVIDEALFRFDAEKGGRYLLQTTGAQTNLLMRIYDAKGATLFQNTGDGRTLNVRCAFEAAAAGTYYVGVCQNIADEFSDEPAYTPAHIALSSAATVDGVPDAWDPLDDAVDGATGLVPMPGKAGDNPVTVDDVGNGWHKMGPTDWTDVFMIGARSGLTYALRVSLKTPETAFNSLSAEVFTLSGKSERAVYTAGDVNASSSEPLMFTATAHATYYVRLRVKGGQGLDYPDYKLHAMAYATTGEALGILTVNTHGADGATWSLDRETVKYPGGASVLVNGSHTIKFGAVSGFKAPAAVTKQVAPGKIPTVVEAYYSDTFDPKDDSAKGATALALKNVESVLTRTLWSVDPEDNFSIAGADGCYYDFAIRNPEGNGVEFSITNAEHGVVAAGKNVVSKLPLPKTKSKYFLTVKNGAGATEYGGYALAGKVANVGTIKFAKTAASAKEDAASVIVAVNRTAKDGKVRVRYGTVAGTAKPGEDYVAQNGVLEWADGDNKAKTISVKLIPDLVPTYEGDKTFSVQIKPMEAEEQAADEYPATIVGGDVCTVTLKETAKAGSTVADAYAKFQPKLATTKTEEVPLESGTFYGVLREDGAILTNGLPRLASVTFTASATKDAKPSKLSAKVMLAGKTYTFAGTGWEDGGEGEKTKVLELVQKVNKLDEETGKSTSVTVTNTLTVTVGAGSTAENGAWLKSGGEVELVMNVPDANNKGHQEDVAYRGEIYRNNAKIQGYLNVVTNFTGYYTAALAPDTAAGDGVPAGNGYLTLTVDNKGTVKAAGMLADGSTKPSISAAACAIVEDAASSSGYSMMVPIFLAKSPYCFGGVLRLYANAEGTVVVDSSATLEWNNDNKALSYDNENGYQIELTPVGGWYDKVINLQRHYRNRDFSVETAETWDFPEETVAEGFSLVDGSGPNEMSVDLSGDMFSVEKQVLVKRGKLFDLDKSVNKPGLQVKFTRATGVLTGSFSLWSENGDGSAQQQIKGMKANGVALLARDEYAPFADDVVTAGFFTQQVTVVDEDPNTGKKTNRKWTFSAPFNIIGFDLGDVDWWHDDWGEGE